MINGSLAGLDTILQLTGRSQPLVGSLLTGRQV